MDKDLLSLKWNNHNVSFHTMLSTIRSKELFNDVTLACGGKFYTVHKFVLSTCSEYFEEMFHRTMCKHPVIVLKDISCHDLEYLLDYMYIGEVNVPQSKLSSLIDAAECLKIRGLAVPDEAPIENLKRPGDTLITPPNKKCKDDSSNVSEQNHQKSRCKVDEQGSFHADNSISKDSNLVSIKDHYNKKQRLCMQSADEQTFVETSISENGQHLPNSDELYADANIKGEPIDVVDTSYDGDDTDFKLELPLEIKHPSQEDDVSTNRAISEPSLLGNTGTSALEEFTMRIPRVLQDIPSVYTSHKSGPNDTQSMAVPSEDWMHSAAFGGQDVATHLVDGVIIQSSNSSNYDTILHSDQPTVKATWSTLSLAGECVKQCSLCSYSTTRMSNMKNHLQRHMGEKPYACPFCDFRCTHKPYLKVHLRTHTGEKPYKCPQCPYSAAQKNHVKAHVLSLHQGQSLLPVE